MALQWKMRKSENISFSLCDCEGTRVVVALGFQEACESNINRRNPRGFVRIPNTLLGQSDGSWASIQGYRGSWDLVFFSKMRKSENMPTSTCSFSCRTSTFFDET